MKIPKLPSIEQAISLLYQGLQAFVDEVEEIIETIINKLREVFQ